MKIWTPVNVDTDVDVEIDLDDVIEDMSDAEKHQLIKKLRGQLKSPELLTEEEKIWQDVRLAACAGDMTRLLSLVETIAWKHHQVFVDTSRIARAAA